MNDLTIPLDGQIPMAPPILTPLPEPLSGWYYAVESGAEYPDQLPTLVRHQSEEALAAFEQLLTPVPERHLREWLAPIPLGTRNPGKSPGELQGWIAAVFLACEGVPACLFTRATQREALRTFDFFPSAADIYRLVATEKGRLTNRAYILRRIMETPTEEER